jgi:hypothetical protein
MLSRDSRQVSTISEKKKVRYLIASKSGRDRFELIDEIAFSPQANSNSQNGCDGAGGAIARLHQDESICGKVA